MAIGAPSRRQLFEPAGANLDRSVDIWDSGSSLPAGQAVNGTLEGENYGPRDAVDGYPIGSSVVCNSTGDSIDLTMNTGTVWQVLAHGWFRIKTISHDGSSNPFLIANYFNTNLTAYVGVAPDGTFRARNTLHNYNFNSVIPVPFDRWFELKWYFHAPDSGGQRVIVKLRYPGDVAWTAVIDEHLAGPVTYQVTKVRFGCMGTSGGGSFGIGRMAAPRIWNFATNAADVDAPTHLDSGVIDPTEERHVWRVDYVNGSDDNDGTTARPIKTIGKLNTMMSQGSICALALDTTAVAAAHSTYNTARLAGTDNLTVTRTAFDEAMAALWDDGEADKIELVGTGMDTEGAHVGITGQGLWVDLQGTTLDARQTLANGTWELADGYTNVYEYTLAGGSGIGSVLWRNDLWIAKLNLNAYADEAALLTALDAVVAPTFYTNAGGTIIYYAGTNPTTDGATYQRSYRRNAAEYSAIVVLAPNVRVSNGTITGTCRVTVNGSPGVDYSLQIGPDGATGFHLVEGIISQKAARHSFGLISNANACVTLWKDLEADSCTAYDNTFTMLVDFRGGGTGSSYSHYFGCDITGYRGVIGAAGGESSGSAYYAHLAVGAGPVVADFWDCDFGDGNITTEGIMAQKATIHDSTFGWCAWADADGIEARRCTITRAGIGATGNLTVYNSVIKFVDSIAGNAYRSVGGAATFYGNTLDFTAATSGRGALLDGGTVTLTGKGNLLLFGNQVNGWIYGSTTSDTIALDWNVYEGSSTNVRPLLNYNDGATTANRAFQFGGQDANSERVTDANIDGTTYVPAFGSDAIGLIPSGTITQLDGTLDYLGVVREGRLTAGAIQVALTARRRTQLSGGFQTLGL